MKRFSDYVRGYNAVPDISKAQRFLQRPPLASLFTDNVLREPPERNNVIASAVKEHGYSQKEVADYLAMHFTFISRVMRKS